MIRIFDSGTLFTKRIINIHYSTILTILEKNVRGTVGTGTYPLNLDPLIQLHHLLLNHLRIGGPGEFLTHAADTKFPLVPTLYPAPLLSAL